MSKPVPRRGGHGASIDEPVWYHRATYRDPSHKVTLQQKVPTLSTKGECKAYSPTTLTFKGHLFELTIGGAIRERKGSPLFTAGIGRTTLKD